MKDKEFGKRLQNMRKIKGLSCEALADMVFVNVGYIRQMEAGEIPGVQLLLHSQGFWIHHQAIYWDFLKGCLGKIKSL